MDRRAFLKTGAILPAAAALPELSLAQSAFDPRPTEKWRGFEVTTRVEIVFPQGATRVWLPIPSVDSGYQKTLDNAWSGNAQTAKIVHDGTYGADMLYAEWPTAEKNPVIELYSRFATRDVYGVRVAKSQFGYRSLGAGTANITRAQHRRAEVHLAGFGWVPVDPADVRKVVLEEKAQPTDLSDPVVQAVRPKLFGAWEMNWLAFNTANDFALPNSKGGKLTFFMYPQAETAQGRL